MRKRLTRQPNASFSEPLDHRGVVLVGAPAGRCRTADASGYKQIQQADIVVYDRLVSDDIMNPVRRDADVVFCGNARLPLRPTGKKSTRSCCVKRKR